MCWWGERPHRWLNLFKITSKKDSLFPAILQKWPSWEATDCSISMDRKTSEFRQPNVQVYLHSLRHRNGRRRKRIRLSQATYSLVETFPRSRRIEEFQERNNFQMVVCKEKRTSTTDFLGSYNCFKSWTFIFTNLVLYCANLNFQLKY